MLDDFGLVPALRWYVESHLRSPGLDMEIDLPAANLRLPSEVETALYRIAQESLGNIARHSHATRAVVVARDPAGLRGDARQRQRAWASTRTT